MNTKRDYYDVLGISKTASEQEITKAYRTLTKKYHPDISKENNATEKFKEVQKAYETLKDPQKRSNYDNFGHDAYNQQTSSGFQGFSNSGGFDFVDDIFETFFGGRTSKNNSQKTKVQKDLHVEMTISFLDAVLGTEKKIDLDIEEDCPQCNATGAKESKDIILCSSCNGSGYITKTQRIFLGNINTKQVCNKCRGTGHIILNKCFLCKGDKRIKNKKTFTINIPAGVEDGMTLQLEEKGNKGHLGVSNGDLYILFHVLKHENFERKENDIFSNVDITFSQATLGAIIDIKTIYGEINLKIPAGTQTNTKFRLKHKGVSYLNTYRKGDHYVIVKIITPTKLSYEQKQLFRRLQELE
ncbi:molecular chaperone DnaJ [Candidatus Phytoplasma pini]|uniref:Chaperone protein DnaJ n=1 Tax=Candidatus Phytoplasma pini TaxID=267362 RepID=A0A559KJG9_9MOLU|nr:molecular chaperone DnaJ [Candidatus Phytoplasma pini]TVY12259.1 Chaperone protein [Candidatus Phytoplasma pini]